MDGEKEAKDTTVSDEDVHVKIEAVKGFAPLVMRFEPGCTCVNLSKSSEGEYFLWLGASDKRHDPDLYHKPEEDENVYGVAAIRIHSVQMAACIIHNMSRIIMEMKNDEAAKEADEEDEHDEQGE